ncbi:MAG: glycine cleavage system aminomethyltransferase GcvT [Gammaproteobacteria bacterium]|nr:glycine cleavage system aminomethyltransferase GcvT [Gammaproteobacteria bacterium]
MTSAGESHPDQGLARTPLHDLHVALGARMVAFAGYEMPLSFAQGIIHEHLHTRSAAGLFDVSHMGQLRVAGAGAAEWLETLAPSDLVDLPVDHLRYTVLTNERGGVRDDVLIGNCGDHYRGVINAACKRADVDYMRERCPSGCELEVLAGQALIALQGPAACAVLERIVPGVSALTFMTAAGFMLAGARLWISRSGYTGEDGFEISLPAAEAGNLARALLEHREVEPIGLGARDSLRLEAGLCLYGHELDARTTPVEAGLGWTIPRVRRGGGARAGGFPGDSVILDALRNGVSRRLVGIRADGRAPIREGARLVDDDEREAGVVTSGGFGPSVSGPVAMGYVASGLARAGVPLRAAVRGKLLAARVAKLPFVERRYFRG